jgi:hypothetical protein
MHTVPQVVVALLCLTTGVLVSACDQDTVLPMPITDLHVTVIDGFIAANLMPITAPDPVSCRLTLLVTNTSTDGSFFGLRVINGIVFVDSSHATLGTFTFTSDWNGHLSPGETVTVHLTKTAAPGALFIPRCGTMVGVRLTIQDFTRNATSVTADSLMFLCVY